MSRVALPSARRQTRWPRWATALLLLAAAGLSIPSCANRAEYVCDVLDKCGFLAISIDTCIDRIGIAVDSDLVEQDEVSHCLDCIVENSCQEIESHCFDDKCKTTLEAIAKELEMTGTGGSSGAAGAAGEAGSP